MKPVRILRHWHWLLSSQFGIDPLKTVRGLSLLPRYVRELRAFRQLKGSERFRLSLKPCLHDWSAQGGGADTDYFWQDLLVAQEIFRAAPERHVDIGSRIDGFVAHIASFREVEVFDVRPVDTKIPSVTFRQADFMEGIPPEYVEYADSVSCLHVIEHFGLGRYGDPICERGYERGIENLARLLKGGGTLYLSTPFGEPEVRFNSHYIFELEPFLTLAEEYGLLLERLQLLLPKGDVREFGADDLASAVTLLGKQDGGLQGVLGIMVFRKKGGRA
ncbi:DUF268 domain-containing protein [bacterium]|nr:DUF268 domain-containing protein [bacterium]